ncbi:MAG: precorrin-2 C(20)-methyltransferase [bacterium]
MTGKIYVIGIGPGDPELLTLKAVRILKEAPCICVPRGKEDGNSLALTIVEKAIDLQGKEIIPAYFPMRKTRDSQKSGQDEIESRWNETIEKILNRINRGMDVAFITLGDPTIYSTFFYLYPRLLELSDEIVTEIIPGVSSITAGGAKAKLPLALGDETLMIVPANYMSRVKELLLRFDTIVLMKVNKVFDEVVILLEEMGTLDKAIYVSRAGMTDEKIIRDLKQVKETDLDYFSLIIVKK